MIAVDDISNIHVKFFYRAGIRLGPASTSMKPSADSIVTSSTHSWNWSTVIVSQAAPGSALGFKYFSLLQASLPINLGHVC
jgi:hypothetical protein